MDINCTEKIGHEIHCHQFDIRLKNLVFDLKKSKLCHVQCGKLRVPDFTFSFVPKSDKKLYQRIKAFIIRHEWLGTMPHRPTHCFIATYNGELAGVVIMSTPNAFSNLLGKENRNREKLISRGACISWAPKNLNSALVMYSHTSPLSVNQSDNIDTKESVFTISGTVTDRNNVHTKIYLNNNLIFETDNKLFEAMLSLVSGQNNIRITSKDEIGNQGGRYNLIPYRV